MQFLNKTRIDTVELMPEGYTWGEAEDAAGSTGQTVEVDTTRRFVEVENLTLYGKVCQFLAKGDK